MVYDRLAVERRLTDYADALGERGYYEAWLDHAIRHGAGTRRSTSRCTWIRGRSCRSNLTATVCRPRCVTSSCRSRSRDPSTQTCWKIPPGGSRRISARRGSGRLRPAIPTMKLIASCAWCFRIDRGRQYRITEPEIVGNHVLAREESPGDARCAGRADAFVESAFQAGVVALAEAYRGAGYAQVQVTAEPSKKRPRRRRRLTAHQAPPW